MTGPRRVPESLSRWPLLLTGVVLLVGQDLFRDAPDWLRGVVAAAGLILLGSGIVLVAWGHRDPLYRDPRSRTRATDRATPAVPPVPPTDTGPG